MSAMTILDHEGQTIAVGDRVADWPDTGVTVGRVVELTEPDGDVDDEGRSIALGPYVIVEYDTGDRERWTATWNATGPWDDDCMEFTCDDVLVRKEVAIRDPQ